MNGVTLLSQHYKNYVNYIKNVAKSKMFTYIKHRHIARCAQGCQSSGDLAVDSGGLFETSSWKIVYLSINTRSSLDLSSGKMWAKNSQKKPKTLNLKNPLHQFVDINYMKMCANFHDFNLST